LDYYTEHSLLILTPLHYSSYTFPSFRICLCYVHVGPAHINLLEGVQKLTFALIESVLSSTLVHMKIYYLWQIKKKENVILSIKFIWGILFLHILWLIDPPWTTTM